MFDWTHLPRIISRPIARVHYPSASTRCQQAKIAIQSLDSLRTEKNVLSDN
jgi:hypothetical protein